MRLGAWLASLLAACSFPEVTIDSASSSSGSGNGSATGGAAGTAGASSSGSSSGSAGAGGEGGTDCTNPDADEDGFDAMACGGDDCCDVPAGGENVHPEVTAYSSDPTACGNFDWNCADGEEMNRSQLFTGSCSDLDACLNDKQGFGEDGACGQTAGYVRCVMDALDCIPEVGTGTSKLKCR